MKILFPTPIEYDGNDSRYLQRDGARYAQWLCENGHTGIKIIIDDGRGYPAPESPLLIAAPWTSWCSPDFWKEQNADGVLLYGGLDPRLPPVIRAIRQAGLRLILKMDLGEGLLDFPAYASMYLRRFYFLGLEKGRGTIFACFDALWRTAKWASGGSFARAKTQFPLCDIITFENEFAAENTRHWLNKRGLENMVGRIATLPHPVPDQFCYDDSHPKRKQLLAVALDWRNPRKGGKLLIPTLLKVLARHTDYTAVIVGKHSEEIQARIAEKSPAIAERIQAVPCLPSIETLDYYRQSQIFLLTSGSESGPIVAFEAVCCGCSIALTPEMFHLSDIVQAGHGTLATHRTTTALAAAIEHEIQQWQNHPARGLDIANHHGSFYHVAPAAQKLLSWMICG